MLTRARARVRTFALKVLTGLCTITLVIAPGPPRAAGPAARRGSIIVDSARGALNVFRPERAWGAALDGHEKDETAAIYTPGNIAAMNSAGFGPVTYRLRTELAIEAWHWNPRGRWSDADHAQGYWTSSDTASAAIERSFGYRLPRRGRTIDDANNDGYSRLDDGDTASFWKSNPYLDPRFTGESEAAHPQWVVVDLGAPRRIDAARLAWGAPYARHYVLDYWDGDQTTDIDRNPAGTWRTFPRGEVTGGLGGDVALSLTPRAVASRFVRLTLLESSHTAAGGNGDRRDSVGFALREISLGTMDRSGTLHDAVRHGRSAARQSEMLVSSTDPWHRESDRDDNIEQPGLDLVVGSGLTHGLPLLVPVPVLFDTPDNAAALLRFLRRRGYPVPRLELGEEPDGQRVSPEDFAALYLQVAEALRSEDPGITLGGPSRQNLFDEPLAIWPGSGPSARASWTGRMYSWLAARHHARDLAFFSFEWYPFDDACAPTPPALARAPALLDAALANLRQGGLPDSIPLVLTEYGYSAHAGPAEVEIASALFNADALARFFAAGGTEAYVYGWEPGTLGRWAHCASEGNNLLFLADELGRAHYRMPAYHAARLLTRAWADSAGGQHEMFAASVRAARPDSGAGLVSAYALRRPDHRWSLLLINRDPAHAWSVDARIRTDAGERPLAGPFDVWQYSRAQYAWRGDGERGHPVRDEPPTHRISAAGIAGLPPYSITVLLEH